MDKRNVVFTHDYSRMGKASIIRLESDNPVVKALFSKKNGSSMTIVETPDENELRDIVKMLGITAEQLVRKKEPLYKEQYEGKEISDVEWLHILKENPILIERPIVVLGDKAIIGRPPETIIEFIKKESK